MMRCIALSTLLVLLVNIQHSSSAAQVRYKCGDIETSKCLGQYKKDTPCCRTTGDCPAVQKCKSSFCCASSGGSNIAIIHDSHYKEPNSNNNLEGESIAYVCGDIKASQCNGLYKENTPCCKSIGDCPVHEACNSSHCCNKSSSANTVNSIYNDNARSPAVIIGGSIPTNGSGSDNGAHIYRLDNMTNISSDYPGLDINRVPLYSPTDAPPDSAILLTSLKSVKAGYHVLANGVYKARDITVAEGVLRAETVGGVIIRGGQMSVSLINGGILDGFVFDSCAPSAASGLIEMGRGRLTRCSFMNITGEDTDRRRVINGAGQGPAIIDHNQIYSSCTSSLVLEASVGVGTVMYRNYIADRCSKFASELYRCGASSRALDACNFYSDENLIVRNGGEENEGASNKASFIYTRGNTWIGNAGSISSRFGANHTYIANTIIEGVAGGMRIFGDNHIIRNNYVANCSNYGVSFGIGSDCSDSFGDYSDCGYMAGLNIVFDSNVIENSLLMFGVSGKRATVCPTFKSFYNNSYAEIKVDRNCSVPTETFLTNDLDTNSVVDVVSPLMTSPRQLSHAEVGPFGI